MLATSAVTARKERHAAESDGIGGPDAEDEPREEPSEPAANRLAPPKAEISGESAGTSDGELPELTRAVLEEGIRSREAIKQRIRQWQADDLRL